MDMMKKKSRVIFYFSQGNLLPLKAMKNAIATQAAQITAIE